MKQILIKLLPNSVLNWVKKTISKPKQFNFIQNINWDPTNEHQPRILISYITDPFYNEGKEVRSTRGIECAIIVKEFIKRGYRIDVVDSRDMNRWTILSTINYNLIFGFGDLFYQFSKNKNCDKRILYLTEKHPTFSYQKESERIAYYKERYGKTIPHSRSNLYYKEDHFNHIDAIVYIGNKDEDKLIPVNKPKYPIKPTGLYNPAYNPQKRNISESQKNFLWFGSLGAVHKGLDLLIDVFNKQEECNLYIGGLGMLEKKQLPKFKKNIIDLGYVNVNSDSFLDLIYKCSFVIFPSCSEALSTGVITCMNHGLIPIVTKEVGFKLDEFGIELADFKIETIEKTIKKVIQKEIGWFANQHTLVYEFSHQTYSRNCFQTNFAHICEEIIS